MQPYCPGLTVAQPRGLRQNDSDVNGQRDMVAISGSHRVTKPQRSVVYPRKDAGRAGRHHKQCNSSLCC
jgi:hypothetical protein